MERKIQETQRKVERAATEHKSYQDLLEQNQSKRVALENELEKFGSELGKSEELKKQIEEINGTRAELEAQIQVFAG